MLGDRFFNRSRGYCRRASRNDVDIRPLIATGAEFYHAIDQSKQRKVFTQTHVFTGVVLRAALTNNNVAGNSRLTAEELHA